MITKVNRVESRNIWEAELREVFRANPAARRRVVKRHQDIYRSGDTEKVVYLVEKGSIRVTAQSVAGRECLLRLQIAGEIFGEGALLGSGGRPETATAREQAIIWQMPAEELLPALRNRELCDELLLEFLRRVGEHERHIADLVTEPSRRRLGKLLLLLGSRIGTRTSEGLRINLWISHDEWAGMVGTTRPRVTEFFCEFKKENLVSVTRERHLIIREARLQSYLGEP